MVGCVLEALSLWCLCVWVFNWGRNELNWCGGGAALRCLCVWVFNWGRNELNWCGGGVMHSSLVLSGDSAWREAEVKHPTGQEKPAQWRTVFTSYKYTVFSAFLSSLTK